MKNLRLPTALATAALLLLAFGCSQATQPAPSGATNLLANGDFLQLTAKGAAGTLPPYPDPNAENSWLNWSAWIVSNSAQWVSMFTNGTDPGHTSASDTSKVIIYGNGGNYTATLSQSVTSVTAGSYSASAWVLPGNWSYHVTIEALDGNGNVIGSKVGNYDLSTSTSSQAANSTDWQQLSCPVTVAAGGPVTFKLILNCDTVPGWSSSDTSHNTFIRVDDCALTAN
jgi:hypothetical protein